jgi:MFS family permease
LNIVEEFIMFQQSSIQPSTLRLLSPKIAFLIVSFSLGELGDGLNIFQGIYLVGIGWNEGSVGLALSLMGLTALVIQPWAGDWVDKTTVDRRIFLGVASLVTALSASAILFVGEGNTDHMLIFTTKIVEGVAASFIGPCLAALTLATFGPHHFDRIMASNIFWGHVGSVVAAILAGLVSYLLYPQIKACFLVIGASALFACFFVQYLVSLNNSAREFDSGCVLIYCRRKSYQATLR